MEKNHFIWKMENQYKIEHKKHVLNESGRVRMRDSSLIDNLCDK